MRVRVDIWKVIVLLYENYKKALDQDFVMKPISYALYHTWKYVDKVEKSRMKGE